MILRNADMKTNTYNEPPASVRHYIEASGLRKPADLCEKMEYLVEQIKRRRVKSRIKVER